MHPATLSAVARLSAKDFRTRAEYAHEDDQIVLRDRLIAIADELDRVADTLKELLTEMSEPATTLGANYVPSLSN